jgi:hypothetical protein
LATEDCEGGLFAISSELDGRLAISLTTKTPPDFDPASQRIDSVTKTKASWFIFVRDGDFIKLSIKSSHASTNVNGQQNKTACPEILRR